MQNHFKTTQHSYPMLLSIELSSSLAAQLSSAQLSSAQLKSSWRLPDYLPLSRTPEIPANRNLSVLQTPIKNVPAKK